MVEVLRARLSLHKLIVILSQMIVNRLDKAAWDLCDLRFAPLGRNW
jgi:hypothetical protein